MTTGDGRQAALEQLEAALRADDGDAKDFHVREAIQLLHIEIEAAPASDDGANQMAE